MVVSLADGLRWIELPGANTYVLDDGGTVTLVDAGAPTDAERLRNALEEAVDGPAAVDRILLTHFDIDHVGGFGRIDGLDARVYAGRADAPTVAGEHKPSITARKGLLHRLFAWWARPPVGDVIPVDDGDEIGGFTAYHTPGHTAGHTVFVHADRSVAFLGDLVVSKRAGFQPPHRFLGADAAETRRSIRRLAAEGPSFEIAAPGHGRPTRTDGSARLRACADELD